MTKREQAQVVELLRCAADSGHTVFWTAVLIGAPDRIETAASAARWYASAFGYMNYRLECLEAAVRVEEGSWP